MNTRYFRLVVIVLGFGTFFPVHAARKEKSKGSAAAGESHANSGMPSAKIEPLLEPALDAILAPLEKDPGMPRVEVEKLRSSFAGGEIKANTPGLKRVYQNAMAVCSALTKAMDDRATAKSNALASAKVPSISEARGVVKSSPVRGVDAGANAEAIRKKQLDERRFLEKDARARSAFVESAAYKAWTQKSASLRENVMSLYTRQIQLEALEEKSTAAESKPKPAPAAPAPAVERIAPPKKVSLDKLVLGAWKDRGNTELHHTLKADHTCLRKMATGRELDGTWTWVDEKARKARLKFENDSEWEIVFAEDGKTGAVTNLSTRSKGRKSTWVRVD